MNEQGKFKTIEDENLMFTCLALILWEVGKIFNYTLKEDENLKHMIFSY